MFSRPHLLIERDLQKIQKDDLWGIEAYPLTDENIFECTAKVKGLKGTAWEGGIFRLYIRFDEHYNVRPPEVCFHTIPFHPNVDVITGRPCIDFLDDYTLWKDTYTIGYILMNIQLLLCNPVIENAVNLDAADMLITSPHSYRQMVQDCVAASQRVDAGLSPHLDQDTRVRFGPTEVTDTNPQTGSQSISLRKAARISFDDYLTTWTGIATSKNNFEEKNPLLEALQENPKLQNIHYGLTLQELEEQMKRQLDEHSMLTYGKFKKKQSEEEEKAKKLAQLNKIRKIYLPRRTPPPGSTSPSFPRSATGRVSQVSTNHHGQFSPKSPRHLDPPMAVTGENPIGEAWEHEVDDLVAWTMKLDEEAL
ncbi:ubiquitin-conjugating enzyme E2 U [Lingula anatina]|uniref:Ubiquitin-conjugating enzyme E2 U n=1 Tax=Lingula anatina TaxID=7574 RepID=A0A1S3H6J2_LINAN|nr:ubiquitin-conjugating enzyme E2 U [Lingula anatina]XP_013380749.1 ubiquitin-conjugating enzyme E2 U [Lingula anatina]|eukprot:XP_013380748.1 ubiquitin-conjugating enzyme E2 U [Lingula anatina]